MTFLIACLLVTGCFAAPSGNTTASTTTTTTAVPTTTTTAAPTTTTTAAPTTTTTAPTTTNTAPTTTTTSSLSPLGSVVSSVTNTSNGVVYSVTQHFSFGSPQVSSSSIGNVVVSHSSLPVSSSPFSSSIFSSSPFGSSFISSPFIPSPIIPTPIITSPFRIFRQNNNALASMRNRTQQSIINAGRLHRQKFAAVQNSIRQTQQAIQSTMRNMFHPFSSSFFG